MFQIVMSLMVGITGLQTFICIGIHLSWMILNFNKCFKVKYSTLSVIDAVLGVLLPFFLVFAFNLTKYKFKLLAEESLQNKCDDNSKIINTLSHGISITKDV